jgi:hypothetical protein
MEPDDIHRAVPVPAGQMEPSSGCPVLAAGAGMDHSLEETMKLTKHGLLAAVAATALVAGAGAFAQQNPSAPSGSGIQSGSQMEKQENKAPGAAQTQQKPEPRGQAQDMKPGQAQQAPSGSQLQSGSEGTRGGQKAGEAKKDMQPGGSKAAQDTKPGDSKAAQDTKPGDSKAAQDSKSDSKSVQINSEQRTKISQTIKQQSNLKRVSRSEVNFTINVGTVVPRTVGLVVLPCADRRDRSAVPRLPLHRG